MQKILQRFLIFFAGLPVLLLLVIFLPAYNHLCLNLTVVLFAVLGALEFQNILKEKDLYIPLPETAILGGMVPALTTASVSFGFSGFFIIIIMMAAFSWLLLSRIFSAAKEQKMFINRAAAGFSVIIYPGIFLSWIIAMSAFSASVILIVVFLLMVFLNDSAAWAAGMLFGKGNRGIIPVSPNKSIAGFAGGIIASLLIGLGGVIFFPEIFTARLLPPVFSAILLGLFTGIAAALGDLGESVLKRSAGIKDSGFIIPGRGGILDSIDSIAMAAPVYYLVIRLLFVTL